MRSTGNNKKEELLRDHAVRARIAERAYFISESEGFPMGRETAHWLQAEIEIIEELQKGTRNEERGTRGKGAASQGTRNEERGTSAGKPTNGKAAAPKAAKKPRATASSAKAKKPASKKS